jgi:hypothetical protein
MELICNSLRRLPDKKTAKDLCPELQQTHTKKQEIASLSLLLVDA